jgi:hypothetical protein
VIIVHADATSEFYRLGDSDERWCCRASPLIHAMLAWEVETLGHEPALPSVSAP